jgi:cobyrinic acid a,c-diamide synthase
MCGVLPSTSSSSTAAGPWIHPYASLEGNPFFPPGAEIKGHEFHHSRLVDADPGLCYTYEIVRGHGIDGRRDGILYKNTFATYNHIHAVANPEWAPRFVELAVKWRKGRR